MREGGSACFLLFCAFSLDPIFFDSILTTLQGVVFFFQKRSMMIMDERSSVVSKTFSSKGKVFKLPSRLRSETWSAWTLWGPRKY